VEAATPGPVFRPHDEHLDEGDILAGVPFGKWTDGTLGEGTPGRGIITSHGCACEDHERAVDLGRTQAARKVMLHVAPLQPAVHFRAESQRDRCRAAPIRSGCPRGCDSDRRSGARAPLHAYTMRSACSMFNVSVEST
jgi:hypothetical protein